jgi:hypothetical protein
MAKAKTAKKPAAKPVKAVKKPANPAEPSKPVKSAKTVKPSKPVKQPAKSRFQTPLLFLAAVLAIGVVIFLDFNAESTDTPSSQQSGSHESAVVFANQVIEHLRQGECAQIADKTSLGFQAVIAEQTWLEQCGIASGVLTGAVEDFELADTNTEDDITEISYKIVATDEQTYIVTTQLVYRDGIWQLQGINSQVE